MQEHFMFCFLYLMSPMFHCYHHRKKNCFPWYNLFPLGLFSLNNNPMVSFARIPLFLLFCLTHLFTILFIFLNHALPMAGSWRNVFSILPILMPDPAPIQFFGFFAGDLSLMMSIRRILVSCFGKIP